MISVHIVFVFPGRNAVRVVMASGQSGRVVFVRGLLMPWLMVTAAAVSFAATRRVARNRVARQKALWPGVWASCAAPR